MMDDLSPLILLRYPAVGDPEILPRVHRNVLAYRMQSPVPELGPHLPG